MMSNIKWKMVIKFSLFICQIRLLFQFVIKDYIIRIDFLTASRSNDLGRANCENCVKMV